MKNKKGAEMTVGTIIIIILALVVLVFLIFGFTRGTGNLFENIRNFFGGGANIQTVVTSCQTACATNSVYDWCRYRDVKFKEGDKAEPYNCLELSKMSVGLDACPGINSCTGKCVNTTPNHPGCEQKTTFRDCEALKEQNCTWR